MEKKLRSGSTKKTSTTTSVLIDFVQSVFPLTPEMISFIEANSRVIKVRKGKFLLKPGEICTDYYYIHKGVLRAYLKFGSKEVTTWINEERELTTSISSMCRQSPSKEYIQAIEDCELVTFSFETAQKLYELFPELNLFGRLLITEYFAIAEEQTFISRIPNAEARYSYFCQQRPDLNNRIALKYIASYLGMTMKTISRVKAKQRTSKELSIPPFPLV